MAKRTKRARKSARTKKRGARKPQRKHKAARGEPEETEKFTYQKTFTPKADDS